MPNTFKLGNRVKAVIPSTQRRNGKVRHIACYLATAAGGKICSKVLCPHAVKDHVWVVWPDNSMYSYHYSNLDMELSQAPTPALSETTDVPSVAAEAPAPKKDDYIEKAKDAIAKLTKPKTPAVDFFRGYNGFDKMKFDRSGKPYIQSEFTTGPEISAEELDWDTYRDVGVPTRKKK